MLIYLGLVAPIAAFPALMLLERLERWTTQAPRPAKPSTSRRSGVTSRSAAAPSPPTPSPNPTMS